MTTQSRTLITIDDDIAFLTEQVRALKMLGERDEADDEAVYDLSIRWGAALAGRLPRLAHYSSAGMLDDADQHRVRSLYEELRGVSELADKLGLVRPALPGENDERISGRGRLTMRSRFLMRRRPG